MTRLPPSVLIVDDSSIARGQLARIIASMGITNTGKAGDGATALTMLDNHKYDVVLLDWNMPRLNGMDVLKAMRSDPSNRAVRVIMVTSEALKENIVAAVRAGADDYVVKPFKDEILKDKVRRLLANKPAERDG